MENKKNEIDKKIEKGNILLNNIKDWINNADIKISILIGFMGIILGYVVMDSNINLFNRIINVIKSKNITIIQIIKGFLIVSLYISMFFSFVKLIEALKAKINIKDYKERDLTVKSLLFYGSISKMKYNEYINKIQKQTETSEMNDIYSQIYINSKICNKKFKCYNLGLHACIITIALLSICKILNII